MRKKGGKSMRKSAVLEFLLIFCLLTGCASYTPVTTKLGAQGPTVTAQPKDDLVVSVDEYATKEKSKKAFDTDMAKEGVLALLVSIQNGGQQTFEIKPSDINLREGETSLKVLSPKEAAKKAKREYVMKAIGWSLIVPIISIPVAVAVSADHTSKVNDKIAQDFSAKAFAGGTLAPGNEVTGFVFFELKRGRKDLGGLVLEVKGENRATKECTTVICDLPMVAFKAVRANTESTEEKVEEKKRAEPGALLK
jgi:hypothetical protein